MLDGRFHSHITVDGPLEGIFKWTRDNKGKFTLIDLVSDDKEQSDIMGTFYSKFDPGVCKQEVFEHFDEIAKKAADYDLTVKRLKVEVDKVPNTYKEAVDSATLYWEGHIKLDLPKGYKLDFLKKELGSSWVFSKNPQLHKSADRIYQFINLREYKDSSVFYDKVIDIMVRLEVFLIRVDELKTENVIIDTNHDLDKWWA